MMSDVRCTMSDGRWGFSLLQLDDVRPAGGGVLALEVVLDGISKDVGGDASAVPAGVLLGSQHYGLAALQTVDTTKLFPVPAFLLEASPRYSLTPRESRAYASKMLTLLWSFL